MTDWILSDCCFWEAPFSVVIPNYPFGEVFTLGCLAGGVIVPYIGGLLFIFVLSFLSQLSLHFIQKFFVRNLPIYVCHCLCSRTPSLAVSLQLVSVFKFEIKVLCRIFYVHDFLCHQELLLTAQ